MIMPIIQELAALSQFNQQNREALYEALTEDPDVIIERHSTISSKPHSNNEPHQKTYTFQDLAGHIPQDVREVTDFIKNAEQYERVGAQMPKGILLHGPGGTGKTSIARAIAGEVDAAFFQASGSDFVEVYVGVGPQRVRELFDQARHALQAKTVERAIIFIDEIDAIGSSRGGEANSEYRNTLNELLNQLDGFDQSENIFIVAATNMPAVLDKALLRPGRFDRIVEIPLPSQTSRRDIFSHYIKSIAYTGSTDAITNASNKTPGFSGAEIKNIVNEAAILAARENIDYVAERHLEHACNKALQQKKHR
jgi:ATP-dependent Zn protease